MRERNALVVGCNYTGTNVALRGCVQDANDWADVLTARGYNVRRLLDTDATRANILGELLRLTETTGYLGRAVFTYSGHGTVTPDLDGDEPDRLDEALVPADYRTAGLITDDALHLALSRRKFGTRLLTISDSCYSGTIHRDLAHPDDPLNIGTPTARFLPPDEILTRQQLGILARSADADGRITPTGTPRPNGILLSGCAENEVSYDAYIGGAYRGAMTHHAIQTLKRLPPGATYAQWHAAIRDPHTGLPSRQYNQSPQIQGTRTQQRWPVLT